MVELAKAPTRWAIGAPDGLNLVPLEKLRQLVVILRHDASERNSEIVPQRQIGLAAGPVLSAAENLVNQLVAFLAVFADERLDVLERRRLERLEAVPLVHVANDTNDVLAPADVGRQEITCAAGRLNVSGRQDGMRDRGGRAVQARHRPSIARRDREATQAPRPIRSPV